MDPDPDEFYPPVRCSAAWVEGWAYTFDAGQRERQQQDGRVVGLRQHVWLSFHSDARVLFFVLVVISATL